MAQVSKLTIDNTKVPSNQTDFPVYVDLSDMNADFWSTVVDTTLQENIVSYWKLDETTGNATDSIGSNTLTNTNTVGYASSLINNGADFGTTVEHNKKLNRADGLGVDLSGAFSISFWTKIRTAPANNNVVNRFIDWRSSTGTTRYMLFGYKQQSGTLKLEWDISGTSSTYDTTLSTSAFSHICITCSSGGTYKIYLNNVQIGTGSRGTGTSSNLFALGGAVDTTINGAASYMDEVGVWSKELTSAEVGTLYNSGDGIQGSNYKSGGDIRIYKSSANASVNTNTLDLEASSSEYASIADASQTGLDITGDLTMEAWVKKESTGTQIVAGKYQSTTNNVSYALASGTSDLQLYISDTGSSTDIALTAYTIPLNEWVHLAVTYVASTGAVVFYANGIEVGTDTSTKTSIYNGTAEFTIGAINTASTPANEWDGLIADVRVWSDIRTDAEISEYYNEQLLGTEANLEGYWKLDGDLLDYTSGAQENNNDLTHSGTATYTADVPYTIAGELPRELVSCDVATNTHSLDLEASSSQYASITDAAQTGLDITSDLTLEAWIKLESQPATSSNFWITGKWGTNNANHAYAMSYQSDAGDAKTLAFSCADGTSQYTANVSWTPSTAIWYHVAVSYDASAGSATFYVDGVQQGTTQTGLGTSITNNTEPYVIGVNYNSGTSVQFFDGLIDEVRVWDDIRTSTEINDNKSVVLSGSEANLQGYWKLDNDYTDSTPNGNDLTPTNSPVFSTDSAFTYVGGYGELHFKYTGTLSSTTDTEIAVYADGVSSDYATTDTYGAEAVWSDYQAVYHLEDLTKDSTGNGYDTTNTNSVLSGTGQIDSGADMTSSNTNKLLKLSSNMGFSNGDISISAWIYRYNGDFSIPIQVQNSTTDIEYEFKYESGIKAVRNRLGVGEDQTTAQTMSQDIWHYFVANYDSSTVRGYLNAGTPQTVSSTGNGTTGSQNVMSIGSDVNASNGANQLFADFQFDEVRFTTNVLSADWITTEYNNQNSPSTFYTATSLTTAEVTTEAVSDINQFTSTGNGTVVDEGESSVTERGVCWSTSSGPTTADSTSSTTGGLGAFNVPMAGLNGNTTYYVKAYMINTEGTFYGSEVSFTTSAAGLGFFTFKNKFFR